MRLPSATYWITWRWAESEAVSAFADEIQATDAGRAINKLKKRLSEEYSDVNANFVPVEAIRRD